MSDDVNTKYLMNRTALHCAVANSNTEGVNILLSFGADVLSQDCNGYQCLHIAASRRAPVEIIASLLVAGADKVFPHDTIWHIKGEQKKSLTF